MSEDMGKDIASAIRGVTKSWKTAKRHADSKDRVSRNSLQRMRVHYHKVTVRDAAFQVMEDAFNKASSNGRYYANARQIMYAARPDIIRMTGNDRPWSNSSYFTQTLLKDYIERINPSWVYKIVWDARGHFKEPHTGKSIGLGGAEVVGYKDLWGDGFFDKEPEINFNERVKTNGPVNRYGAILFIEKEGFNEILSAESIPEKYDIAIMSSKGIPTGAACDIANMAESKNVSIFVLHDFDYDGFKIVHTLRKGTRLKSGTNVVDLGFRLEDIQGLQDEEVSRSRTPYAEYDLKRYGATKEEIDFLIKDNFHSGLYGRRVELNAMTSEQLITWIEKKLTEHKIQKVIPEKDTLVDAYYRALYCQKIMEKIDGDDFAKEIQERVDKENIDIQKSVEERLKEKPIESWDEAIWNIAENNNENDKKED